MASSDTKDDPKLETDSITSSKILSEDADVSIPQTSTTESFLDKAKQFRKELEVAKSSGNSTVIRTIATSFW